MNGFASSILSRIQDIVSSNYNSYNLQLNRSQNNSSLTLAAPLAVTNPQDRKIIEKCYRSMDGVINLCRQPSLNLKKSPPCILDILPEIYSILDAIFNANSEILQQNAYIQLYMDNLYSKCKQTIRIFKEERGKIFDETSKSRRSLTMKALIFSHMSSELRAEFSSDGQFIGDKFRITKKEAAEFWSNSFQNKTVVSWEQFREQFNKIHPINFGIETHALKSTIDLTCNDHISNFEFDVFTRLFQPWPTLLKNWQILAVTHPAYVAFLTYEEVKSKLQQYINKPGSYVFRQSCTKLGQWAIGYVAPDRKIYQTIPHNKSLIQSLVEGSREGFYVYPNGRNRNVDLSHALSSYPPQDRLKVTSEQYQIYCEMGTTFEMCKICDERNKNIKLEPCGHLLCRPCLRSWEESAEGGSTCPFCRCEIKGTENVFIDSYHPSTSCNSKKPSRRRSVPSENNANAKKEDILCVNKQNDAESILSGTINTESATSNNENKNRAVHPLHPEVPPRGQPPPLPPKRVLSPPLPAAILLKSHEIIPKKQDFNLGMEDDSSEKNLIGINSEAPVLQGDSNSFAQTTKNENDVCSTNNLKYEKPGTSNASDQCTPVPALDSCFTSLSDPFAQDASHTYFSGMPESLPRFSDFMEMDLTRN